MSCLLAIGQRSRRDGRAIEAMLNKIAIPAGSGTVVTAPFTRTGLPSIEPAVSLAKWTLNSAGEYGIMTSLLKNSELWLVHVPMIGVSRNSSGWLMWEVPFASV